MVGLPNRNRQAERREATRTEILDAAWTVAELHGIAGVTLKEVALRVAMKPPSLYTHFDSKNAIYDAMFEQAWSDYKRVIDAAHPTMPDDPREALLLIAQTFFDFATSNVARHQLMSARVIPGFEPSARAYEPAVAVIGRLHATLPELGIHDETASDLFTALIAGLINQQVANDPGGSRWRRLLPRAIDMYADEMGLARPTTRRPT